MKSSDAHRSTGLLSASASGCVLSSTASIRPSANAIQSYDSVQMVMGMLAGYRIPEGHRTAYEKLAAAVNRCDWDGIDDALKEEEQ